MARRQAARVAARLGEAVPVEIIAASGQDPGSLVFVWGPRAGFSALGARGKPAEQVADEAVEAYLAFRASGAACDRHLADQMLIYLALADGAFPLHHRGRHLASSHQRLGYRAVPGADFSD